VHAFDAAFRWLAAAPRPLLYYSESGAGNHAGKIPIRQILLMIKFLYHAKCNGCHDMKHFYTIEMDERSAGLFRDHSVFRDHSALQK
jgi:hypothetical protein